MTISNEVNKSGPYSYNGAATDFAYKFKIDNAAHIRVVETVIATGVETDLVLNSDYTVSGVGDDEGAIVIAPARAAGKSVTMVRNVPFTQQTVLENQGAYFAKVVEAALDAGVARDQQLAEELGRTVRVPLSSDPADLETLIGGVVALLDNVDAVVTVAGISTRVVAVAANSVNVNIVAANIVGVQTTADNMAAVLAAPALAAATAADRVQTGQDRTATAADRVATGQDRAATAADRVATGQDRSATAADLVATGQDKSATAADRVQTGIDRAAAAASAALAQTFAYAVSYVAQALTEAQKLIARNNIGAASKMDTRPNLSVNGSLIDSQENGDTLGTANGYFYGDQHALYRSGTLGVSVQRVAYTSLAGGKYAGEFKCTTAKTTLGATDLVTDTEVIEGSRPEWVAAGFGAAGAKQFVYRKEVQKPAGLYHFHFSNSAGNRHCAVPYTISAGQANAKTVVEVVVPGDTSGTWLKTDGVIGLVIDDVLVAGSTFTGGSPSTWGGTAYYAASAQANFLSSTANVSRHTDFGLKLDPDATGVYGAYEVGEVDAVYRSERYLPVFSQTGSGSIRPAGIGQALGTTSALVICSLPVVPARPITGIVVSGATDIDITGATGTQLKSTAISFSYAREATVALTVNVAAGFAAGNATIAFLNKTPSFIIFTGARLA